MFNWIRNWLTAGIADQVVAQVLANEELRQQLSKLTAETVDYDQLASSLHETGLDYHRLAEGISVSDIASEFDASDIAESLKDEIDFDEIAQKVVDEIDQDEVATKVAENIDHDDIAREIRENFEFDYSELEIDYAALGRELVSMASRR